MSASIARDMEVGTDFLALYGDKLGNVDIDDSEVVIYGPVDVALGYISLRGQGQRLYSARL
jgi:hypothetical protein